MPDAAPGEDGGIALQADNAKKADKVAESIAGHFASLDAEGNLADSGIADRFSGDEDGTLPVIGADGTLQGSEIPARYVATSVLAETRGKSLIFNNVILGGVTADVHIFGRTVSGTGIVNPAIVITSGDKSKTVALPLTLRSIRDVRDEYDSRTQVFTQRIANNGADILPMAVTRVVVMNDLSLYEGLNAITLNSVTAADDDVILSVTDSRPVPRAHRADVATNAVSGGFALNREAAYRANADTSLEGTMLTDQGTLPGTGLWYITQTYHTVDGSATSRKQIAMGSASGNAYTRYWANGAWGAWMQLATLARADLVLLNGWINAWGVTPSAQRIGDRTFLTGLITNGVTAGGTVLFNIPAGMRPPNGMHTTAISNAGLGVGIAIEPGGRCLLPAGTGAVSRPISLNTISFPAV